MYVMHFLTALLNCFRGVQKDIN